MPKKFICSSTEPIVQTNCGKIRGYYFDDINTFSGIKYADAKRFRMPTPVKPWEGVKDALHYGHIAPLLAPFDISTEMLMPHRLWPENEHCQYLNIWSPSLDPESKMPVMVWLHGGGFSAGSSIEQVAYDGHNLSKYGDVIVVTLNHRLNILGFLDFSAFGQEYENSGNSGMADIVEALKWIQSNILAFGGDPDNITIFGQSGGGGKVTALCQIPTAVGLFHKAIIMSGIANVDKNTERNDEIIVREMLNQLGIPSNDVQRLETLPLSQLAKTYIKVGETLGIHSMQMRTGPTPNNWYLGNPLTVGFSEYAKKVPTIAGTVIAEFSYSQNIPQKNELSPEARRKVIASKYNADTDELIRLFKKAYPDKNELDILSLDTQFRTPTLQYLEEKSAVANTPVYSYMFSLEFDYEDGKPAWHCADIPFAFHNTELVPVCNVENVTDKLVEQFYGAFVNFAYTGNPNHDSLPHWPAFTLQHKATMVFDRISEVRVNYDIELMNLLSKH